MNFYYELDASNLMLIDDYISYIWTIRYYTYGDFQLILPLKNKYLQNIKKGKIISRKDSNIKMLIEKIEINLDSENGNTLILFGRSLEIYLSYRIIAKQFNFSGTVEDGIRQAITENCISPTDETRKLPISLSDKKKFSDKFDIQVSYENVGDWICDICKSYKYGWRLLNGKTFELYLGQNRTDLVTFSSENSNLISANYYSDIQNHKNVCFVGGEGEGKNRKVYEFENTAAGTIASGLSRKEIYVDARDLSTNNGEISDLAYQQKMAERGFTELENNIELNEFSAVVSDSTYKYGIDYFVGDIVNIDTGNLKTKARIIEIIESDGEDGHNIVPTLSATEV